MIFFMSDSLFVSQFHRASGVIIKCVVSYPKTRDVQERAKNSFEDLEPSNLWHFILKNTENY